MKSKSILLFIMLLMVAACSSEDIVLEQENNCAMTRQVINKSYYSLGVSYEITEDYLDNDAAKYPVVDIDAFLSDNQNSYHNNPTTEGEVFVYAGATAEDFAKDIVTKNSIKIGQSVDVKGLSLSRSIKFNNDLTSKYSYSSQYSFARADVVKRVKRVYLNATPTVLQRYLYPEFLRDLNALSPRDFVAMYGTHVLLDITIGGRLQFNYRSIIEETTSVNDKKKAVEAGLKLNVKKVGATLDASYSTQEIVTWNRKNATWKTWVKYMGGEGSGQSFTFNSETGNSTVSFNLDKWESSVNDKNAGLVEVNWNKTYPIYDFISNATKRQQIKNAVEEYVNNQKLEIIEMLPLYRLYKSGNKNTFFTTSLSEAQNYIGRYDYVFDSAETHYIQGYVMKNSASGTLPLYRLYKSGIQNTFFTIYMNEAQNYIKKYDYEFDNADTHYIQGYVFQKEEAGTVPLYRLYKSGNKNTFFTTSLIEAGHYINKYNYAFDNADTYYIQGFLIPKEGY